MNMTELEQFITKHEGKKLKPYTDIFGNISIGIGRNLSGPGISDEEARYLFLNDVNRVIHEVETIFPWYQNLNDNRKMVLIDLCFNMGLKKLLGFPNMLTALSQGFYDVAAEELLNSAYANQVGARAQENAKIIRKG